MSRGCLILALILLGEVLFIQTKDQQTLILIGSCSGSVAATFFVNNIMLQPFIQGRQVDSGRLFVDALISTLLMVLVFGLLYRLFGIQPIATPGEALYFSAVTFSTLGFGDFTPARATAQALAGMQAIIGNLHLGFVVGATFAAIR